MRFDELTMKDFKARVSKKPAVIWPVGATEEHGDHLPLCTDSIQPEHIADEVAKLTGALVAPPLRYGNCGSTANFPGTISLSFDTLRAVARDVISELARQGFSRIVVISGHAGRLHMAALRLAAEDVLDERPDLRIVVMSDYDIAYGIKDDAIPEDDGHAGMMETSRVMAITPYLVKGRGKKFKPDFPKYRILRDAERYFPGGVMGDPTKAIAEKGREWNRYIVKEIAKLVEEL
jgi:creatinine amidohydrolase